MLFQVYSVFGRISHCNPYCKFNLKFRPWRSWAIMLEIFVADKCTKRHNKNSQPTCLDVFDKNWHALLGWPVSLWPVSLATVSPPRPGTLPDVMISCEMLFLLAILLYCITTIYLDSALQCSTIQFNSLQCRLPQCNAAQCSAVHLYDPAGLQDCLCFWAPQPQ